MHTGCPGCMVDADGAQLLVSGVETLGFHQDPQDEFLVLDEVQVRQESVTHAERRYHQVVGEVERVQRDN